jgi:hypothetical protein
MKKFKKINPRGSVQEESLKVTPDRRLNPLQLFLAPNFIISLLMALYLGIPMSCTDNGVTPEKITGTDVPEQEKSELYNFDLNTVAELETSHLKTWTNGDYPNQWNEFFISDFAEPYYYLNTTSTDRNDSGSKIFTCQAFDINTYEKGDRLKITWRVKLQSINFASGSYYPKVAVGLKKGLDRIQYGDWRILKSEGEEWIEMTDYFWLKGMGIYQVFFYCEIQSPINQMTIRWNEVSYTHLRELR